jgi:DNA invertase Pin-like site-specific DNA recombinase
MNTTAAKQTAIIYLRVSTNRQSETGHSLENQERQLAAYADSQGYQVEIFPEIASGGRDTRPQLKRALDLLNAGEAQALFVVSIDRLARSTKHALSVIEQATKNKWRLVVANIGADTSNTQGRFIFQLMAVIAELENNLISDRVKRQHEARRERGIVWGIDQGFKGNLDPEIRAEILFLNSLELSLRQIAADLEAKGYQTPNGGKWHAQTIKAILNSPQTQALKQAA